MDSLCAQYDTGTLGIVGTAPYAMDNTAHLLGYPSRQPKAGSRAEAARSAYWMPDRSSLCITGDQMRAAMIEAGKEFTFGDDRPVNRLVPISVKFPAAIPLGTREYVIHRQVIRAGYRNQVRAMAMVVNWQATFVVRYCVLTAQFMQTTFLEIMQRAGLVGLGATRAAGRAGAKGTFRVSSWTLDGVADQETAHG